MTDTKARLHRAEPMCIRRSEAASCDCKSDCKESENIYVFDDSFSALDMKTDARLRAALSEVTKNSTVIIVAQRISTILHADQILVLDDGKIVGKGTHEELLENCDVYMQIAQSQLSAKELGLDDKAAETATDKAADNATKKRYFGCIRLR